ncbi:tetratricopeptide repeat protein [Nostoc sp. ChiVER01]|uniref:tetratricopeptide repeat protein n=1 Tax=Nostoc sp. ChiVER01 TaxID=3075382 RepID=UPI002AD351D0|nr:tetratricopeptide repeat protein [Nostoc sp. ChiVER01]MDZ8224096.1 tetratricopeptide repeat protein [Nostoc sp. ChiVER01]
MNYNSQELANKDFEIPEHFSKAIHEYRVGNLEKVREILELILLKNSHYIEALKLKAMLAHRTNNLQEAIVEYKKVISITSNDAICYTGLGNIYQQQANFDEAISYYQKALLLANNCNIYFGLATCFTAQKNLDEAINYLTKGLKIEPDNPKLRCERGINLLKKGDYENGLPDFEYRLKLPDIINYHFLKDTMWDGSDLNGKEIVLHIGSRLSRAIQLIRYAPLVAQRGGNVIFACAKPLLRLFSNVSGITQLVDREITSANFEVNASLLSLPYLFGTTVSTIPVNVPYIFPCKPEEWTAWNIQSLLQAASDTRLKIGIVWKTGEYERSGSLCEKDCPLSYFINLLSIPYISLYSLQVGKLSSEIHEFKHESRLYDLTPQIKDFADTAALIYQLDLVISVDTAVAHLAGAMGSPIWTLLALAARAGRQPLVSDDATVPPTSIWRLGKRFSASYSRFKTAFS